MRQPFQQGVQDCPHCFMRVYLFADGACPRCQKNALDTATINTELRAIWLRELDRLPDCCQLCGAGASRKVRTEQSRAWEEGEGTSNTRHVMAIAVGIFVGLVSNIFGLIWYLIVRDKGGGSNRGYQKIVLQLPRCNACSNVNIEPAGASFPDGALKIVAHRIFVNEFERCESAREGFRDAA